MIEKISFKVNKDFKNEREFTTWFGSEVKKRGWFFHKISDIDFRLKPFDAILWYDGILAWIEFKYTKSAKCYVYRMLRWSSPKNPWSQVKWLQTYYDNGGVALVIIYSSKTRTYKVFHYKDLDFNSYVSLYA